MHQEEEESHKHTMLKQKKRTHIKRPGQSNALKSSQNNAHTNAQRERKPQPTVNTAEEYPLSTIHGSLDYPLPQPFTKTTIHTINDIPKYAFRQPALFKGLYEVTSEDINDPVTMILITNRKNSKKYMLGGMEIDSTGKKPMVKQLVNKFIQRDSLSTPMKRIRDEVVDVSSSIKKNKRIVSVQDTTMELSFEGKAMNRSDLVKLVDSSGIMLDDTNMMSMMDTDTSVIDTRNLLQNTEFSFEYHRR